MNIGKEPIVRTKRTLMVFLTLFPWLSKFVHADSSVPTIPPGRSFKWDIGPKGSLIEQEFMVAEYRVYHFDIGFGSKKSPDDKDQSWREDDRNWIFIKGGRNVLNDGTYPYPSVVVPVHIKVEKLNGPSLPVLMTEQTVNTDKFYAGGNVVKRQIIHLKLKPGTYRVSAMTIKDSPLPESLGSYLQIGFYAKASVLNDNE